MNQVGSVVRAWDDTVPALEMKHSAHLFVLMIGILGGACSENITYDIDTPWSDSTVYPDVGAAKILVTNSGDDTLSWLDPSSLEVVFSEPVGRLPTEREGPHHAVALPDGSFVFVGISNNVAGSGGGPHGSHGTGTADGYLLKYDTETHVLVDETRIDRSPSDVSITSDGKYVLVSHFDLLLIEEVLATGGSIDQMNSRLAIVDAESMEVVGMADVCPALHGIGIAADDSVAYVTCWGSDELAVVTLAEPFSVERYSVGEGTVDPSAPTYEPYSAQVSPRDGSVWVSCLGTNDIRVFDPTSRAFGEPIPMPGTPFFGDFTADGAYFVVPLQDADSVAVVDSIALAVSTLAFSGASCQAPHSALVLPGDSEAVLVCEGDRASPGFVARVALSPLAFENHAEVGVYPDDATLVVGAE